MERRMSKERKRSKWDTPELEGGVTLYGQGGPINTPGPHRSFSYTIHAYPSTGYETIQTCDVVTNPITCERQLVTITASKYNVTKVGVDKINDNLLTIESALKTIPYDCRVLQSGECFEIQTYLPKDISKTEKYDIEQKILQIVRNVK